MTDMIHDGLDSHHPSLRWVNGEPRGYAEAGRQLALTAMRRIDTLSNQRWHFFRKLLNNYDFSSREIAVNRAFYKLWELLAPHRAKLLHKGCCTLHLAEAPGSFVQVVKTMCESARVVAVSKPPSSYADVVRKGRAIPIFSPEVTILPGADFHYIDLLRGSTIRNLVNKLREDVAPLGFDLITGDGGFDEEERYDEKEVLHYKLILGEVICMLLLQKLGGSCILKVFDTFTVTTAHILYLLCQHYSSHEIIKPRTSRPTNSERYIVCHGFKGTAKRSPEELLVLMDTPLKNGMILNHTIPDTFCAEVEHVADRLAKDQAHSISNVLEYISRNEGSAFIDKRDFAKGKSKTFAGWKELFGYG